MIHGFRDRAERVGGRSGETDRGRDERQLQVQVGYITGNRVERKLYYPGSREEPDRGEGIFTFRDADTLQGRGDVVGFLVRVLFMWQAEEQAFKCFSGFGDNHVPLGSVSHEGSPVPTQWEKGMKRVVMDVRRCKCFVAGNTIVPINGEQVQVVYGESLGSVTFKWDLYFLSFHCFVFLTGIEYE